MKNYPNNGGDSKKIVRWRNCFTHWVDSLRLKFLDAVSNPVLTTKVKH
jgi:hypothetical protein